MMHDPIGTVVLITDALVGWDVTTLPELDPDHYHCWFDDRHFARAYARGIAIGAGWSVQDETTANDIGVIGGAM